MAQEFASDLARWFVFRVSHESAVRCWLGLQSSEGLRLPFPKAQPPSSIGLLECSDNAAAGVLPRDWSRRGNKAEVTIPLWSRIRNNAPALLPYSINQKGVTKSSPCPRRGIRLHLQHREYRIICGHILNSDLLKPKGWEKRPQFSLMIHWWRNRELHHSHFILP